MTSQVVMQQTNEPVDQFRRVLADAGLLPGDVLPDGIGRRCPTVGHPRKLNGWYVMFEDGHGGAYQNHETGDVQFWTATGEPLPQEDRLRLREQFAKQRAERQAKSAKTRQAAAFKAQQYLDGLNAATAQNFYLQKKGCKPCFGLKVDGQDLIVPVAGPDGKMVSYQRIAPDGSKKFLYGGSVAGGFFVVGPKGNGGDPLLVAEGLATALTLHEATGWTCLVAFNASNLEAVAKLARSRYPSRQIIICGDNDLGTEAKIGKNPGAEYARIAAMAVNGLVTVPEKDGDWNDVHAAQGIEAVKAGIMGAIIPDKEPSSVAIDDYPEPVPLPDGLPPVAGFEFELLPGTMRPWAADIVDRMQCPPDFVAVAIMAALGAVIGRQIGIRPQSSTDWTVICNNWAMLIGRPGVLKSPAMEASLAPLKRLAALSLERYQAELADHEKQKIAEKLRAEATEKAARAALKKDPGADLSDILNIEMTEAPILARYMANDTTAAALGELHRQNPNGLLVFRDELVSLIKMLDQEENAEARGFYLTGWNGDSPYTFDRITRGMHLHIPAVCLSLLGSTQPARIAQYVKSAVKGTNDDGLLQRFGLIVWPDVSGSWQEVDRWPNINAKLQAHKIFERLHQLDPFTIGAQQDIGPDGEPEGVPYLRFDPTSLGMFREWRQGLETRLRSGDLHPAFESHLSKYRKLVPGLALIIHLASGGTGSVGRPAVLRALAWCEYLETHARRLYASVAAPDAATAQAILKKIQNGALPTVLTARQILRPQWTNLTDLEEIKAGLKLLVERDWLFETRQDTGGRPVYEYRLNPRAEVSE